MNSEPPAFLQALIEKWVVDAIRALLAQAGDGTPEAKDLVVRATLKATVEFASKHRTPAEVAAALHELADALDPSRRP